MLAPALAALLAVLQPTGRTSWLELDVAAQLLAATGHEPVLFDNLGPMQLSWNRVEGHASAGLTVYARGLVDDDAPPPLQPFLQRALRLHVDGGGGGGRIDYAAPPGGSAASTDTVVGSLDAWADGYLGGHIYFDVGFSLADYGFDRHASTGLPAQTSSELLLRPQLAVGVRFENVLIDAGWSVSPYQLNGGSFQVRTWGGWLLGARAVVRRWLELGLDVTGLDGGALADGFASLWLRRRFGLGVSAYGGHGGYVDSPDVFDRLGGSVGVAWWLTPRIATQLDYEVYWNEASQREMVVHLLTLRVLVRPR